ncbi:MAG: metallopeptidase TldD-related protein, partial [Acidimicrobiales bacterium]
LVSRARAEASSAAPADDASELISPAGSHRGEATAFEDRGEGVSVDHLAPVLEGLGDMLSRSADEGRTCAGFAHQEIATTWLASSTGLRLRHTQPAARLEVSARGASGAGSAWAGAEARDLSEVSLDSLESRLVKGLSWSDRHVDLPAGRYEAVLPKEVVADLVIMIEWSLSGRSAEEGRSVFSAPGGGTKVGERLSGLDFELYGDPSEPELRCAPFLAAPGTSADVSVFDNGLGISRTGWITKGCLSQLCYHRAGARRFGTTAAAPVDNLILDLPGAEASLDELVARTGRGLLLTCLWYIREVDPSTLLLTGLTRDGVYLVEKGEVVGAVNNFRFNESPLDVLSRTIEAGASQPALSREWGEHRPRTAMPPLHVDGFNMSSVSPAI